MRHYVIYSFLFVAILAADLAFAAPHSGSQNDVIKGAEDESEKPPATKEENSLLGTSGGDYQQEMLANPFANSYARAKSIKQSDGLDAIATPEAGADAEITKDSESAVQATQPGQLIRNSQGAEDSLLR